MAQRQEHLGQEALRSEEVVAKKKKEKKYIIKENKLIDDLCRH